MDFINYVFMTRLVAQLRNNDINRRYVQLMKRLCGDVEYSPTGVLVPSAFRNCMVSTDGTSNNKNDSKDLSGHSPQMPSKKFRAARNPLGVSALKKIFFNLVDLSESDYEKVCISIILPF